MNHDYFSRGVRKWVEVLDDVVAVKVETDDRGAVARERVRTPAGVAKAGMSDDTLAALENANWVFVTNFADVSRSLDAGSAVQRARTSRSGGPPRRRKLRSRHPATQCSGQRRVLRRRPRQS
jgi:hypothetical protein